MMSKILSGLSLLVFLSPMAVVAPSIATPQCPSGYYWHDGLQECRPVSQRFHKARGSGRTCQMPGTPPAEGLPKCTLGSGSGNSTDGNQDPDMGDRQGVPPSAGTGTR